MQANPHGDPNLRVLQGPRPAQIVQVTIPPRKPAKHMYEAAVL